MPREFFMDGETLMVAIPVDASNVVTRPATKEEEADFSTFKQYSGRVELDIDSTQKKPRKKAKK